MKMCFSNFRFLSLQRRQKRADLSCLLSSTSERWWPCAAVDEVSDEIDELTDVAVLARFSCA